MDLQEQPLDLSRPNKHEMEFNQLSYNHLGFNSLSHPTDIPVNLTTSSPTPRRNSFDRPQRPVELRQPRE